MATIDLGQVVGAKGDIGPQGPAGPQGPQGYPANVNGISPDSEGNITLTPPIIGAASNPNLLDNWYFADPINQRNQQTYETSTDGVVYTLDRWMLSGNSLRSITLDSNGIIYSGTGNSNIAQKFEVSIIPPGQTITMSALVENSSNARIQFRHENWTAFNYVDIPDSDDLQLVSVSIPNIVPANNESCFMFTMFARDSEEMSHSVKIRAVKLELGSVQTLAHQDADGSWVLNDPPPNKALELAKCQRYYQQLMGDSEWMIPGFALTYGTTTCALYILLSVPMRTRPTVIFDGLYVNNIAITDIQRDQIGPCALKYRGTLSSAVPSGLYFIDPNGSGYMNLDANL